MKKKKQSDADSSEGHGHREEWGQHQRPVLRSRNTKGRRKGLDNKPKWHRPLWPCRTEQCSQPGKDAQEEAWSLMPGSWKEDCPHRAHVTGHPRPTCRVSLSICISSACFSCSRRLRSPSSSSTFNLQEDHSMTRCRHGHCLVVIQGQGGSQWAALVQAQGSAHTGGLGWPCSLAVG